MGLTMRMDKYAAECVLLSWWSDRKLLYSRLFNVKKKGL
jgi:hypothetical protein